MKSIVISEETHRKFIEEKMQERAKTADELLGKMIIERRKQRLHAASKMFREALDKKGITLAELLRRSRKIREEIADEWYPD